MKAFLFLFPCFFFALFESTYAQNAMRAGATGGGRAYAPIAAAISSLRPSAV
jgi:hypothetical protein